jgi:hypothetical protein
VIRKLFTNAKIAMPRFMLIVKASAKSEAGVMPSVEQLQAMSQFNATMIAAGVMMAGDGLLASSRDSARVVFHASKSEPPEVVPGPFPVQDLVAGYWIIKVKDFEEAVDWVRKCPFDEEGSTVEIRRIAEMEDFGEVPEAMKEEFCKMRKEMEERTKAEEAQ